MALLSVTDLTKEYKARGNTIRAVDNVSFHVKRGETVGLVGESGCGKSTLGRTVMSLLPASSGAIHFDGAKVPTDPARVSARQRQRMQMVFQDPFASLNPRKTVRKILTAPLDVHGIGDRAERATRVEELAERVGISRTSLDRYPHEFSGGQRQRIGIARALIVNPELVVCDEPVSALDLSIQAQILNLLAEMKRDLDLSFLFISHDLSVVRYFTDRILVMYLGRIVESGDTRKVWAQPRHPYTRALIDAIPDPARRRHVASIAGEIPGGTAIDGCKFHPRCPLAQDICRKTSPPLTENADGHSVACHLA